MTFATILLVGRAFPALVLRHRQHAIVLRIRARGDRRQHGGRPLQDKAQCEQELKDDAQHEFTLPLLRPARREEACKAQLRHYSSYDWVNILRTTMRLPMP